MEVRKGYKQTEVGMIPEDWIVKKLGKIIQSTQLGGNYSNSEKETIYPLMKMGNINRGIINLSKVEYITEKVHPSEKDKLNFDDVLFNTRNTLDLVGKVAIWKNELPAAYYNSNIMRMAFKPSYVSSNCFMNYMLNTRGLLTQLKGIATGTTSVAAIYTRDLLKILVPLPTKSEQTAIAAALSDADALISSLEKLIAKKRNIKQGAMQELLTGKKRLPGFSGKWEVKRLGEIAEINMGQSPKSSNYNTKGNGLPLIQGNADIENRKTVIRIFTTEVTKKCVVGDLIMSVRAPVGQISKAVFNACLGRGVCAIRYPNEYLYHYLISQESSWAKLSKGSTFDSVNSADVKALEVHLPTNQEEQSAIAGILTDMDAEIEALEAKLEKYKMVKQGMMQELLTGETRLI